MARDTGIESKGKTKVKNLGDSGSSVGIQSMKGKTGSKTVTNESLMKMGRNEARIANQMGKK